MGYNKHYIRLDGDKIIHGFSDAFEQPQAGDICINEQGGRQFEIMVDGVLHTNFTNWCEDGVPAYKWDGLQGRRRSQAEIDADKPGPTPEQELAGINARLLQIRDDEWLEEVSGNGIMAVAAMNIGPTEKERLIERRKELLSIISESQTA